MANTPERQSELDLCSLWNFNFKQAMVHKAPYTKRWNDYWNAYFGDYFKNVSLPDYRSNLVSNYIFSIIETIRPIMLDGNPKFQALPRHGDGLAFVDDLQDALSYEWDRESITSKLMRDLITTLVTGTSIYFTPWDSHKKQIRAISINPYNFFSDPLATGIEDSEYLIYANYINVVKLKKQFPDKAMQITGGSVNYSELVNDNNKDSNVNNQVLVLEIYTHDFETYEDVKGEVHMKYPNGRMITLCPEIGVVLSDKEIPYESDDNNFPFTLVKDYDVPGKFWGEGEIAQLLSPQQYMNELNNAIVDNAKTTANAPWIVDKNSGIPVDGITSRPGLILRKNPGTEVRREQPTNIPPFIVNAVESYKNDMEQISGIFDSIKGNSETGVYTAQGILALQEAGQARIRLKVKLLEDALGKLATQWFSRMKQFWDADRWIRIAQPDGSYDMKKFRSEALKFEYDIKIVGGSTMNVNRGAMLDLMIRLAQTKMPDGQPLVDREAVVEYLPIEAKSAIIRRMGNKSTILEQHLQQIEQQMQQLTQNVQQFEQQNKTEDDKTLQMVESATTAIETVNKKILQLQQEYAKMIEDKKKQEDLNRVRTDSYNEGYFDAEKLLKSGDNSSANSTSASQDPFSGSATPTDPLTSTSTPQNTPSSANPSAINTDAQLPNELLNGLQSMTNDQLSLLLDQHPEIMDLLKQHQ